MNSLTGKQKLHVTMLFLGLLLIISGLIYSSCNDAVYAQQNVPQLDSLHTADTLATVNIASTKRSLIEQLKKLEQDRIKIIGILEYLDYLEKQNK